MIEARPQTATDRWTVAGGKVRGTSHEICEDCAAWWHSHDGPYAVIAAVADGAGSAALAQAGARAAVRQVLQEGARLRRRVPQSATEAEAVVLSMFQAARKRVEKQARQLISSSRNLATTLSVVVASGNHIVAGQIGDGITVLRSRSNGLMSVSRDRGEYSEFTTFITDNISLPKVHLLVRPLQDVDAFALCSDGLRMLITTNASTGQPYEPFFADAFELVQQGATTENITEFLSTVNDRTGDDKSLVIGVRDI
ncbi:PP2C family serine/threonine-protein phosphatase [Nonomuraea sp. B19D2]|uniref:PP2C family serine/threonine-protein phosphatase n=1 Tax=Nonomuraea sp. B19D2 TaxID=3159561 RepID=UPI0032DA352F